MMTKTLPSACMLQGSEHGGAPPPQRGWDGGELLDTLLCGL
jgi:hypothetical protein